MHKSRTQEEWPSSGERREADQNVFMMVRDRETELTLGD